MFSERALYRIEHIVENTDAIGAYLVGFTFDQFAGDRKTRDACERCLERIIEAIAIIGEAEMQEIDPELPFRPIKGLGNRLRHGYDRINLPTLWDTIRDDLPPLRAACVRILESSKSD